MSEYVQVAHAVEAPSFTVTFNFETQRPGEVRNFKGITSKQYLCLLISSKPEKFI
jgi:hypothetical protein